MLYTLVLVLGTAGGTAGGGAITSRGLGDFKTKAACLEAANDAAMVGVNTARHMVGFVCVRSGERLPGTPTQTE